MTTNRYSLFLIAFLLGAALAPADVKYTTEMGGAGGGMPAMKSTVYVKAQAERRDMDMMGMNLSTITDCAKRQVLTVNWKCKLYMVAPLDAEAPQAMPAMAGPAERPEPERKGGLVVIESNFRDTGERKTLFGLPARHVIMNMKMDAKEGSCNPGQMEMENDMWLVNVEQHACRPKPGEAPPPMPMQRGGCRDRYQTKASGNASLGQGLPVITKFTTVMANGQRHTMTMEIKDLSVSTLEASLFEPPAGFKEAKSQQEMYMCGMGMGQMAEAMRQAREEERAARVPPARAESRGRGEWLIGVILTDRSGKVEPNALADRLVEDIKNIEGFDAVRIDSRTPPEIQQEATEKKCTFLLYGDVREAKSQGPGIGGILGRARRGAEGMLDAKHSMKMDYRLTLVPPAVEEIARDTLSHASADVGTERPTLEDVGRSFMEKTAVRATTDAREWKERQRR